LTAAEWSSAAWRPAPAARPAAAVETIAHGIEESSMASLEVEKLYWAAQGSAGRGLSKGRSG
jgi:hypothetical protein